MTSMPGMSTATVIPRPAIASASRRRWSVLQASVAAWFAVAMAGQLIFASYVLGLYGGGLVAGRMAQWNQVTPRAWLPGETLGNLVFGSHVLFTVVVVMGGLIQLLPALRRRAPRLHRWNGRLFLLSAVVLSLGGIVMILTRGTVGGVWQQVGTGVNGLVILGCAAMAWRHARARRFDLHRRWALRLFLSVSGVWFFRIGLMAWLMIWREPVGFDPESFSGPFLTVLAFGTFTVPLLVLELVFRAQASPQPGLRRATAGLVLALTALTALGIVGATLGMWLPRM
jgi:hypothetical protein